jgi:stage II sporulation protein D
VEGTRGLVLTYDDALIDAVFHSSSAGSATESSGQLWPRQLPYLVSVPDFDRDSPVREWRQPRMQPCLSRAFPELESVSAIEVLSTTATGRVRQARVVGATGVLLLSGAELRSRLGLKSTWVRFALEPLPAAAMPWRPRRCQPLRCSACPPCRP